MCSEQRSDITCMWKVQKRYDNRTLCKSDCRFCDSGYSETIGSAAGCEHCDWENAKWVIPVALVLEILFVGILLWLDCSNPSYLTVLMFKNLTYFYQTVFGIMATTNVNISSEVLRFFAVKIPMNGLRFFLRTFPVLWYLLQEHACFHFLLLANFVLIWLYLLDYWSYFRYSFNFPRGEGNLICLHDDVLV